MVFEASLSLPKSLSSDVSVVFLQCGWPSRHGQQVLCSWGCCSAGRCFFGGRGGLGCLCLSLFKTNSCLSGYFQCGHCMQRGVLAWLCGHIPIAVAPPLRFGGGVVAERPWFPQVPLPPCPSLETVSGFTPNLSLSGTCLRFSAMSDTSKTR